MPDGVLNLAINLEGFVNSSPFYDNGKLYAGSTNALYCVDAKTGYVNWKYPTGEGILNSSPTVFEGKVYFGAGKYITCLDAATGVKLWDIGCPGDIAHPIAISDGQFFVSSQDRIYAFGLAQHNKLWEYPLPNILQHGFAVSYESVWMCMILFLV